MNSEEERTLLEIISNLRAELDRAEAEILALRLENQMLRGELAEKP